MGKITGFLDYPREEMLKSKVKERVKNFKEFEFPRSEKRVETQAARCMNCGIPFCNSACPVDNLIPEFNDLVYNHQWKQAYLILQSTNNFPEFTGRICPAPCEPACTTALVESPVSIKQIEFAIIEKAFKEGWVTPRITDKSAGKTIAVVGSGPAGLAAAAQLSLAGHLVTVFEKKERLGGLLTFGIPDYKLDKSIVERRIDIMRQEQIQFVTSFDASDKENSERLLRDFDFICLCLGAEKPRPLDISGADKKGVFTAMDFLIQQNRMLKNKHYPINQELIAHDKHVIVLGGGDTGVDCVGVGIRQGCKSMHQIQLHKMPPNERYQTNPWPEWPQTFMTLSSHEEGCERVFSVLTKEVVGRDKIEKLILQKIAWPQGQVKSGQRNYELLDEYIELPCDLLLIALGFEHVIHNGLVDDWELKKNNKGHILVDNFQTSKDRVFAAGDMIEGANLVVTAIASGRKMAKALDKKIKGHTDLF